MKLYLHPTMIVADAAILAYENDQRLSTKGGRVELLPGRSASQYDKALKTKALTALARSICITHNT